MLGFIKLFAIDKHEKRYLKYELCIFAGYFLFKKCLYLRLFLMAKLFCHLIYNQPLDILFFRCYDKYRSEEHSIIWVWRSLVACLNGVQEAGSSNLLTQTIKHRSLMIAMFFVSSFR